MPDADTRRQGVRPRCQFQRLEGGLHHDEHRVHALLNAPSEVLHPRLRVHDDQLVFPVVEPLEELAAQHPEGAGATFQRLQYLPHRYQPEVVPLQHILRRDVGDGDALLCQHRRFALHLR